MAWILPAIPLATALLVLAARRRSALAGCGAVAGLVVTLVAGAWSAATEPTGGWSWGPRLGLDLAVTGLGRVMVVLVPAIAVPVVIFAVASMRDDAGLVRLLALLEVFVASMLVLVAARDLLTLLIGWEVVGACSWGLIAHEWRDAERPRFAAHAFLATRAGDLGLLAAAAVAIATTGSARYDALGALHGWPAGVVAAGVLLAAAAKSAQVPFSPWLFSAMAGPTPVSALLHSATMVAAGAYALARLTPLLIGAHWLPGAVAAVGMVTALAGGIVAVVQTDLKRALAASTSAQYGLMFVAVGAGSVGAAGTHLVTHAAFKALLFLGAGVALHATGTLDLGSMRLGRALPFTAVTFAVGAAALAAIPPLGGARSKELILSSAAQDRTLLGIGVIVAGFLSGLYAVRLAALAYGPGEAHRGHDGPSGWERGALFALAGATVALGVLWFPASERFVERATGGTLAASRWWELPVSVLGLGAAGALVVVLVRSDRLLTLGLSPRVQQALGAWLGLPILARHLIVNPILGLARAVAAFDDRVVDAGVSVAAAVPLALSRTTSWWAERGVDGLVHDIAGASLRIGRSSRRVDEAGIDRAVEDLARGTGVAGRHARRLQSGLAHQYYLIVAAGVVVFVALAALAR